MEKRHKIRQNLVAIIGLALSFYFCYHLIAGDRSYLRLISLERQIETTQNSYDVLVSERQDIEQKVVMMRPCR